jgi:tetratricopeptide (TPR) repeat protein
METPNGKEAPENIKRVGKLRGRKGQASGIMPRMKKALFSSLCVALLTLVCAAGVAAQDEVFASRGGDHTLFGDLKIDEGKDGANLPQNFQVILMSRTGVIISRQPVSNNGRYRFLNVANGEYILTVEVEGQEFVRMPLLIQERYKTDVRRDIELEWRTTPGARRDPKTPVTAADLYQRQPSRQEKFERAQEAIAKKDLSRATTLLRQLVEEDPKDFVAWTDLGTLLSREDAAAAEKAFLKAIEEKPNFSLAFVNLGRMRLSAKNYDAAIEVLTRAVEVDPKSADANHYLGEAYLQMKKGSKAVGYLNEAIKLDPIGKSELHVRLATLYNNAGMKDRAAAEYEQLLAKRPDHPDRKKFEQYVAENKKK